MFTGNKGAFRGLEILNHQQGKQVLYRHREDLLTPLLYLHLPRETSHNGFLWIKTWTTLAYFNMTSQPWQQKCSCSQHFSFPEHLSKQACLASLARITIAKNVLMFITVRVNTYIMPKLVSRGKDDLFFWCFVYHAASGKALFYCQGSISLCRVP